MPLQQSNLAPRLAEWCRSAEPAGERTVVIRPDFSTATASAVQQLVAAGARVESAGSGAIAAVVTPSSLTAVAALPWVVAVTEPRTLAPVFSARG